MPTSDEWPARDLWIDERGTRCPVPVISLARAARVAVTGDVIVVLADDPAAANDIPAWCRLTGNEFISATPDTPGAAYAVRISAG